MTTITRFLVASVVTGYRMGTTRRTRLLAIALPWLCGGCSYTSLIRDDVAKNYTCAANQVQVSLMQEHADRYRVTGCGFDLNYDCSVTTVADGNGGYSDVRQCNARQRMEYEATDGTKHSAWFGDEITSKDAMARETALASAAHDIPCDRASLKIMGDDVHGFANIVDGCGQRITYQITEVGDQPATTPIGPVRGHKYIVVNRMPLSGAASPVR